jgi:hypothetical protein
MLKVYDVECNKCGHIEEQYSEDDTSFSDCEKCGGIMTRTFTKFNFKLIYNNKTDICGWGAHNYDRSQYWDNVKAARERGEDAKSPNCKY